MRRLRRYEIVSEQREDRRGASGTMPYDKSTPLRCPDQGEVNQSDELINECILRNFNEAKTDLSVLSVRQIDLDTRFNSFLIEFEEMERPRGQIV